MSVAPLGVGVVLAQVQLACVDGVTPDCADAAARCDPELDGAMVGPDGAAAVDARAVDARSPDAQADAGGD